MPSKFWHSLTAAVMILVAPSFVSAQDVEALRARVAALEWELARARTDLSEALQRAEVSEYALADQEAKDAGIRFGPITIGGAMRVNYVYGDYEPTDDGPSRGGHGGNVELDTFRINADLDAGPWIGKFEYRWYPADSGRSYSLLHTLWLGYQFDEQSHVEIGQNRVPFGPGPYGISQSWFFDQHFYLGLADDPDLGLKYSSVGEDWSWDLGWYWRSEPHFSGRSEDSSRYGYDPVRWRETVDTDGNVAFDVTRSGYREENQGNLRVIRHLGGDVWSTDLGASLQFGGLAGSNVDDGDHWAASLHAVNNLDRWKLALQLTRYGFDIDADNPWSTDELLPFGAYDFAWPVAADAWIPAMSLSYRVDTLALPWLDYVLPYIEYSSIVKSSSDQADSELAVLGAAWSSGGWYIYSDIAWSNGNLFVGNRGDDYSRIDGVGDFGVAGNDRWNYRLNLNFGYYY